MPAILYGTAWKKERTLELVRLAINLGFRGIDTACQPKHYDEASVGKAVSACLSHELRREALYLQTKFTPLSGQDPARVPYDPNASLETQIVSSCQVSLANLQTDYLDCLLLHSPLPSLAATLSAWSTLESLVRDGTAASLGISNCYDLRTLSAICERASVMPAVLQNRFYAKTSYDAELRRFCRAHGIRYQSFWTLTANPHVVGHAKLATIAARHRVTSEQAFFRCLVQLGIVPLTGTTSLTHMQQDLAVMEFELSDDEVASISALLKNH